MRWTLQRPKSLIFSIEKYCSQLPFSVGIKLSFLLCDPIEAIAYDSYVREFIEKHYPNYQNYVMPFWVNSWDDTQKTWPIFVLLQEKNWQLIQMPNPFYSREHEHKSENR